MAAAASSFSMLIRILMFLCIFSCFSASSASKQASAINVTAKCSSHNIINSDSLKDLPHDNTTLRVLVPWKVGFEAFVKFRPDTCWLDGFSIQVFLQALRHMQHSSPPHYKFVLFGLGDETPSYDEMINMLVNAEVDAMVADLTITRERMERVGFTVPYLASSLVMVTPFKYGSAGTLWDFLKPFSSQLWITLLGCFAITGVALYFLEDQNPEFAITSKKRDGESDISSHGGSSTPGVAVAGSIHTRCQSCPTSEKHELEGGGEAGARIDRSPINPPPTRAPIRTSHLPLPSSADEDPNNLPLNDNSSLQRPGPSIYDQASHKRRIMNAYWFTSLCVFQAQQESVRTHLGRIITVMWLFVMLIFNSSYTASLASFLSAQKRYPTIESFQALLKDDNISVGYQQGSFMETYMKNLNLLGHELKDFTSENDYAQALRNGNLNPDGVGAVLDELPYIQILLQSQCDFTKSSNDNDHLPSFGGFGFAFRKGDPLIDQMSKMILEMAEDGTLQILQNGWNIGGDQRSRCDSNGEPSHLRLRSFGGLFSIVASVYIICVIWRFSIRAIKSPDGSCGPLIQALPFSQHGSTIGQTRDLSLSRCSNRVHDGSEDAQIS